VSARSALDEALGYISAESPSGALAVLEQALSAAQGLETLSERGRIVPELNNPSVREVFVFRYRLLYELAGSDVRILAFLHSARDFAQWHRQQ